MSTSPPLVEDREICGKAGQVICGAVIPGHRQVGRQAVDVWGAFA